MCNNEVVIQRRFLWNINIFKIIIYKTVFEVYFKEIIIVL